MKKQLKKLTLNRETLRLPEAFEMDHVNGRGIVTCDAMESGCFSCINNPTDICTAATG